MSVELEPDLTAGGSLLTINLHEMNLTNDDYIMVWVSKDGAPLPLGPYGEGYVEIPCAPASVASDPTITNQCSQFLSNAVTAGDYDVEVHVNTPPIDDTFFATASLTQDITQWWTDYTVVERTSDIFTGSTDLTMRFHSVPDSVDHVTLEAFTDRDFGGNLEFVHSIECSQESAGVYLCDTGNRRIPVLCIQDDFSNFGSDCFSSDYYVQFFVNGIDIGYGYEAILYRLSRYEEGAFFGRQNFEAGWLLQRFFDLDTFIYTSPEPCGYENRSHCYDIGYYDSWLESYRESLADLMTTEGHFDITTGVGTMTVDAFVPRLPIGDNGFRAVAAYALVGDPTDVTEMDLRCFEDRCGQRTAYLPGGTYDVSLRLYNDHPLIEILDFNGNIIEFGQSLFAELPLVGSVDVPAPDPSGERHGQGNRYVLLDSNDLGGPTAQAAERAATTVAEVGSTNDGFERVAIGFPFEFYGTDYTHLYIGSNGYLTFDSGNGHAVAGEVGAIEAVDQPAIFGFFDDLDPSTAGEIRYNTVGAGRDQVFVVEYDGVAHAGAPSSSVDVEVWLFESDGSIEFHYGIIDLAGVDQSNGQGAAVGVQAGHFGAFLQYEFSLGLVVDDLAIRIWPASCHGLAANIVGGRSDDHLVGTDGDDVIYAHLGNDTVAAGAGDDLVCGGAGDDELRGQDGEDTLIGATGRDRLDGGNDRDTLAGGSGRDWLRGRGGSDTLLGQTGNDRLFGGGGHDLIIGGSGDDSVAGGGGRNQIFGGPGDDELFGGAKNDIIVGGGGADWIHAKAGADSIAGGAGRDIVVGSGGDDTIRGGGADDRLRGGAGDDEILGNAGDDLLFGGAGFNALRGGDGTDQCTLTGGSGVTNTCEPALA